LLFQPRLTYTVASNGNARRFDGQTRPALHKATTSQSLARYLPLALVLSAIGVLYSSQPVVNRTNPFAWDISRLSGFATLIVGLLLAGKSKNRFERTMDRLARRGVLERVDEVKKTMERRADRWKHSVAAIAALAEFAFFVSIIVKDHTPTRIPLCLFYTAWAYIAGSYIGRMLAYACIGSQLKSDGASLRVFQGISMAPPDYGRSETSASAKP